MSAAWLVYALAVGTLCAAGAWLAEGALRQRGLPLRWAWGAALVVTVALTASAPLRRSAPEPVTLPAVVTMTRTAAPSVARGGWLEEALATARARVIAGKGAALALLGRAEAAGAGRAVMLAWGTASAALVLLFGAVLARSHRVRRRWPAAVVEGTPVRVSPEAGPFVAGLLRAEIVVPAWLLEAPEDERALVLAHESEHVRARDPALLLAACTVAALLPWHPAVWWMLSRLRLAVELDCDARVLRRGASRGSYGRLLLDLAGRRGAPLLAAPALMDSPTHLERRIEAMTTKLPRFSLARSAAFGGLATLALLAACETKMPTAPEIEKMDVAAMEKHASGFAVIRAPFGDANATFTVDGKPLSAEEAKAIDASEIGTMTVNNTVKDGVKVYTIDIRTKAALAAAGEPVPDGTKIHETITLRGTANPQIKTGGTPSAGSMRMHGWHDKGGNTAFVAYDNDGMKANSALLLIDGKRADVAMLQSLDRERIESVEVIKGEEATRRYSDPQAKNGVVVITTKK